MTEKIAQEDRIPILKSSQNHLKVSNLPCYIDSFNLSAHHPFLVYESESLPFMFHRSSLLYVKY
jgi:hypothetical protein